MKIYGIVKTKENNDPVPGLIISVYASGNTKPQKETSPNPFKIYTQSVGSTITNDDGEFQVEFDLKAFMQVSKIKGKASFILAVLAPSTTDTIGLLASAILYKRLLHWTEFPCSELSQSEAFFIRLQEEQFKKFDLKLPRNRFAPNLEQSVDRFAKAEEDNIRFNALLNEKLAPIRNKQVARRREIIDDAKKFAALVYSTPEVARKSNWVAYRDKTDKAIRNTMEEGLEHIADAGGPSKVGVTLTNDMLVAAGIPEPSRITVNGLEIEHEKLCALLHTRRGGTAMEQVRGLLEARKTKIVPNVVGMSRVAAEETIIAAGLLMGTIDTGYNGAVPIENIISQEPLSGTVMTSGMAVNLVMSAPQEEIPTEAEESALAVSRRVLGQIRDMPVADAAVSMGKSQPLTVEELNALLPSVRLGAGPADVAAFHDFHHLQIAFPHIWTEAFSGQLKENIEALYTLYIELHDEYGIEVTPPTTELLEAQRIDDFLAELQGVENTLTAQAIPSNVRALLARQGYDQITWFYLSPEQRDQVLSLFDTGHRLIFADNGEVSGDVAAFQTTKELFDNPQGALSRLQRLLIETSTRLSEPYAFHYFAPNTVNFGILNTYRQQWEPGQYQVGDLVSTIPLAPGEKRKYSTKQVIKTTRAETELQKSLISKSSEMTTTRRIESEIASKASIRSNFQMTSEGSFRFAIGEISTGTQFSTDQAKESSSQKRDFREAVMKAAQEYKQERSLEVKTTDELTSESTTSGELTNPNNELTVTYLLYELERQYKISERIHRVTPVVLVAQDVPAPHEITEGWLLAHEWILRRVLLDDSFSQALNYLTEAFAGEELSVSVKKANWEKQVNMIKELEATLKGYKASRDDLRNVLIMNETESGMSEIDRKQTLRRAAMLGPFGIQKLNEAGDIAANIDELEVLKQEIESRLEYLEETLKEAQERFVDAQEALNKATNGYTNALELKTNRRVAIDQLRIHVKENILYYMQAIWDHEPPDQRFFRLYHIEVDLPEAPERTCTIRRATEEEEASGIPLIEREGKLYIVEGCEPPTLPAPGSDPKRLVEIADLDRPLGYKGNYIIFPLKTCVYLTDFMMREFFDDYFGVWDPDYAANFSVEELVQYTEELIRDETVSLSDEQLDVLHQLTMTKLRQPRRDSELIVVPTGELYMEALLGEHVLLEKFKLNHRFFDMAKARAEWRETELENLRRAARMLKEEPDLDDPEIDKKIVVEGDSDIHVDTP